MSQQQERSKLWYMLPLFFGIFGGVATWFMTRKSDSKMARNGLLLGIAVTVVVHFGVGALIEYAAPQLMPP